MLQAMREGWARWIVIGLFGLIAVSFIFFGRNLTTTTTGTTFAARVNGEPIDILEFERLLQQQQSQYQQLYEIELTDDMRRELRASLLENMVRNLALEQHVADTGYRVSDERVAESIRSTPAFQADGAFYPDLYRSRLAQNGFTPTQYEEQERVRLAVSDLQDGILNSTFLTPAEFRRYIELSNQRRQVGYAIFEVAAFTDKVTVTDEMLSAHYESNGPLYMTEETVDLEYVEVSRADIAAGITVTEEELRNYYESERERFATEEQRSAHHILIDTDDEAEAMMRADAILARLDAGESFEDLARELSDDPGTRAQGGDLGRIARGVLAGPFEDALYSMSVGEVRGPVRSEFGWHIIRLDAIDEASIEPFEAVRDDLAEQLRTQKSEDLFYDRANTLADRAFYSDGDLAAVAAELMLPLISVDGFSRAGNSDLFENSAAVVQAAFSDPVLNQGRNSDLVELDTDHVLVLRDVAHHEPMQRPFEEVRDQILEELTRNSAGELAREASERFREGVDAAEDLAALAEQQGGRWVEPTWIERTDSALPSALVNRAFALAPPAEGAGPTWEPVPLAGGDEAVLALYAVEAGLPEVIPRAARDERQQELSRQAGATELGAYATAVREAARVRIPDDVLNPTFY
jgi:peptidyl-prolyl cis-trans isomerase D